MTKIKAVVFDFDGTLSDRSKSAYNRYREEIKNLFPNLDENSIEFEGIVQNCCVWDQYGTIRKNFVYEELVKEYGLDRNIIDEMSKQWIDEFYQFTILREGVEETLSELQKSVKIGCITNGQAKSQNNKLDMSGLRKYFESTIVSGEFGKHKPDPSIFLKSCEELNVAPNEMMYVGDTFYADVVGSTRAGCVPVWIWPDKTRECKVDVMRIEKFEDILEVVRNYNEKN